MGWVSAAVSGRDLAAWREELETLRAELGARAPDCCCVFVASEDPDLTRGALDLASEVFSAGALIGCSANGVLGGGREIEAMPALAVSAGHLEGATLRAHHVDAEALATGRLPAMGVAASLVVLADPVTCDAATLLRELNRAAPGRPVVGGLASGAPLDGALPLFADGRLVQGGCVVLEIDGGGWTLETLVAQGCRPIGQPFFVTAAQDQWVRELDGRPAVEVLRELAEQLPEKDRALLRHSLFLGIEMKSQRSHYGRGDFLIRNLVGVDPAQGTIAVAGAPQVGQVVQFQLRDADTAAEDLDGHLCAYVEGASAPPESALLFSCVGRGHGLYGEPDHDSHAFLRRVGGVPLAGFFCNGEIGPVGGEVFLHAYTSAFGMFRRVG